MTDLRGQSHKSSIQNKKKHNILDFNTTHYIPPKSDSMVRFVCPSFDDSRFHGGFVCQWFLGFTPGFHGTYDGVSEWGRQRFMTVHTWKP